jgi:hypothetical protein
MKYHLLIAFVLASTAAASCLGQVVRSGHFRGRQTADLTASQAARVKREQRSRVSADIANQSVSLAASSHKALVVIEAEGQNRASRSRRYRQKQHASARNMVLRLLDSRKRHFATIGAAAASPSSAQKGFPHFRRDGEAARSVSAKRQSRSTGQQSRAADGAKNGSLPAASDHRGSKKDLKASEIPGSRP